MPKKQVNSNDLKEAIVANHQSLGHFQTYSVILQFSQLEKNQDSWKFCKEWTSQQIKLKVIEMLRSNYKNPRASGDGGDGGIVLKPQDLGIL